MLLLLLLFSCLRLANSLTLGPPDFEDTVVVVEAVSLEDFKDVDVEDTDYENLDVVIVNAVKLEDYRAHELGYESHIDDASLEPVTKRPGDHHQERQADVKMLSV